MKMVVGTSPVQDPHLEQVRKNQVIDLSPINASKPLRSSDHVCPQSVIKEEVRVHIPPPLILNDGLVIWFSLLLDPMEGIPGDLSILCQCFHQKETKRVSSDTIFTRIFCPFFNPTSLHTPYPTFLLYAYLCYVHPRSRTNNKNTI